LGWYRLVELHLDHVESGKKGRRCVVNTAISLGVSGGKGQSAVLGLDFWRGCGGGGRGAVILGGSSDLAIVNGIAEGQRTHPVVVAVEETGCIVTGSIVHCAKHEKKGRKEKGRASEVSEMQHTHCTAASVNGA